MGVRQREMWSWKVGGASCVPVRWLDTIPLDFGNCWYRYVFFATVDPKPEPGQGCLLLPLGGSCAFRGRRLNCSRHGQGTRGEPQEWTPKHGELCSEPGSKGTVVSRALSAV